MMRVLWLKNRFFSPVVILILLLFIPFVEVDRIGYPGVIEIGRDCDLLVSDLMALDDLIRVGLETEISPAFLGHLPGDNDLLTGGDLLDEEDLLDRELDDDVGQYEVEWIEAEEGGEIELWENEIEIPEDALDEDTLVGIYIPRSSHIEYWIYPPSLTFNDTVEVKLSYQFADLMWVDESNISIVEWSPLLLRWQTAGGGVDTLNNQVTLRITSFGPPSGNFSRYALADHN